MQADPAEIHNLAAEEPDRVGVIDFQTLNLARPARRDH